MYLKSHVLAENEHVKLPAFSCKLHAAFCQCKTKRSIESLICRNLLETRSGHSRYQPEVTRTVTAYQQYIQHTCALMTDAVPKIVEFHLVTSLVDELATTYMNVSVAHRSPCTKFCFGNILHPVLFRQC